MSAEGVQEVLLSLRSLRHQRDSSFEISNFRFEIILCGFA
jgi:hypothetical protein